MRDLTGITPLAAMPNVLVVSPSRGWKNVADLVAAAKAKPGQLNYASAGVGSATHLNAEKFRLQAGFDAVHVPFKGTPEAMSDVIGGPQRLVLRAAVRGAAAGEGRQAPGAGREHAAALSVLPNVPTTVEAGVPGSDYMFWVGDDRAERDAARRSASACTTKR